MTSSIRGKVGWAVAAAVIVAGAVAIWTLEAQRKVILVSGLDEAVSVRIGPASATVAPHGRADLRVPVGGADVEVRAADGRLLDRHALLVPGGGGRAVYNPLGAAPLFQENIVYSAGKGGGGPGPNLRALGGERFLVISADHVLEDPPKSLSVKETKGFIVRQHVGVQDGGWKSTLGMLQEVPGGYVRANELARRLSAALPADGIAGLWWLRGTAVLEGPEVSGALALAVLAQGERGEWAENALLVSMRRAGRGAELRERYRAQLAKDQRSVAAALRLARVVPLAESAVVVQAAVAAHPEDPEALRAAARILLKSGRAGEAAALFARMGEKSGGDPLQVDALVLSGKLDEALKVGLARATGSDASAADVARYVRLARMKGAKPPKKVEDVVTAWASGRDAAIVWLASLLGEDAPPNRRPELTPVEAAALAIQQAATRDPQAALARCRDAEVGALADVHPEVVVLLLAEAARIGDGALFQRLYAHTDLPFPPEALRAWIDRGEEPPDGWRLDPGERAGVLLARLRRLTAAGSATPMAQLAVFKADPLIGFATIAAVRWKPPEKAAPPVRLVLARPVGR